MAFPSPGTLFTAPFVTSTAVIKRKCTPYIICALFGPSTPDCLPIVRL